jgi:hypothetical protein
MGITCVATANANCVEERGRAAFKNLVISTTECDELRSGRAIATITTTRSSES